VLQTPPITGVHKHRWAQVIVDRGLPRRHLAVQVIDGPFHRHKHLGAQAIAFLRTQHAAQPEAQAIASRTQDSMHLEARGS